MASLLLCLSVVMSIVASFPVALATVLYGRTKGYTTVALTWAASLIISAFILRDPFLAVSYTGSVLVAAVCAEIVLRNANPMKGILVSGIFLIGMVFASVFAVFETADMNVKEFLVQEIESKKGEIQARLEEQTGEGNADAFQVMALLEQPERLAEQAMKEAPAYLMMGVFLTLWANVFLLLKSKRAMLGARGGYTDSFLVRYKNPDHLIWAVIAALALTVFGDQVHPDAGVVGMGALQVLGVFYFFQGFGLYISFLDYMRLKGILRTVLVVATVMTAAKVLALAGLFDMFFNFRRFMKSKNQGE